MKVTLDLTKLLHEGKISREEFERLSRLAADGTGSLAFNILIAFGVVAVSGGALALVPTPMTALAIGVACLVVGLAVIASQATQWVVLANICVLVGALMFGGAVVTLGQGSVASFLLVAAVLGAGAIATRSGLLMVGAVLALSSCIGVRTGYLHATYFLGVSEPTATIVLFSILALVAYHLSKHIGAMYEGLALIAARTALFLVNLSFWIGSLWGDRMIWLRSWSGEGGQAASDRIIADWPFAAVWAVALLGVGAWAVQANRRWVVNIVAVFAAIHFYTQWFERLGATPMSVLAAGLLMLAFAIGLWSFNKQLRGAG